MKLAPHIIVALGLMITIIVELEEAKFVAFLLKKNSCGEHQHFWKCRVRNTENHQIILVVESTALI